MRRGKFALFVTTLVALVTLAPGVAMAQNSAQFMYRLYNPNSGEHFYTASEGERQAIIMAGWKSEGLGWIAPTEGKPVYRLYNWNGGDHHYTASAAEKDGLVALGWKYEGIGWYSDTTDYFPIYRQYNSNALTGSHNYTASKRENDMLVAAGWHAEGIGWYGLPLTSERHVLVTAESDNDYRPFTSNGWKIDIGNIKTGVKAAYVDNMFSEHNGKVANAIPVTITNLTGNSASPVGIQYKVYGPSGQELDDVGFYFDDSIEWMGSLLNGASAKGYLYYLRSGTGSHTIQFEDYSCYNACDFSTMCHDVKFTTSN